MPLPSDSTFISEINKLENPRKYVLAALQRLRECNTKHGSAKVSIGLGGGKRPNFRVMFGHDEWYGRYGSAGTPFNSENKTAQIWEPLEQAWSARFSTLAEIEALAVFLGWEQA